MYLKYVNEMAVLVKNATFCHSVKSTCGRLCSSAYGALQICFMIMIMITTGHGKV